MGPKKETLLRWVNCCFESITPVQKIQELSDGTFFLQILNIENVCNTVDISPWAKISRAVKELTLSTDIINFKAAATRDENELSKLIVVCMHLTMVVKSCEMIQEKTMLNLSNEDQLVIKGILHAIVNDDQLTRARLTEILNEPSSEPFYSKPCTFYSSSPAPPAVKNSPLKRFLDSPMNRRLSRLQKEIIDKNEEISRLQSEIISEADETCGLKAQIDDLCKKIKEYERKQGEMNQRLQDYQLLEKTSHETEAEMAVLKKHLKKMQNDYEISSQKYCDLNIEHEALKTQQDKDRKQMRQLHLDLNEAAARFQRETAGFQLQLDSARIENAQLKHVLDEKKQWIDVLEEKSRSLNDMHSRANMVPKSPGERESIGFSLLSIEAEKLQEELLANRKELLNQKEKSDSEKKMFQARLEDLDTERKKLMQQIESTNAANESLQNQLGQAKSFIEEVSQGCDMLRKEKEQLNMSLETVKSEFHRDMDQAQQQLEIREHELSKKSDFIRSLEQSISETLGLQVNLQKAVDELSAEKTQLSQKIELLEHNCLEMQTVLETTRSEFVHQLEDKAGQLKSTQDQLADQLQAISRMEKTVEDIGRDLASSKDECALLQEDKCRLSQLKEDVDHANADLRASLESSRQEFRNCEQKWQLAESEISGKLTSVTAQLEETRQQKSVLEDRLHDYDELQKERDSVSAELQTKKREILEQTEFMNSLELQHQETIKQLGNLESVVAVFEKEAEEYVATNRYLEDQIAQLQKTIESKTAIVHVKEDELLQQKAALESAQAQLEQSETRCSQLQVDNGRFGQVVVELESTLKQVRQNHSESKIEIDSLITEKNELMIEKNSLHEEVEVLRNQIELSRTEIGDLTAVRLSLEQQMQAMSSQHQEDLDQQLRSETELQNKFSRLQVERENLQFERSSFEQLYMEIKAAYEEAEAHFQVELELAREEKLAKDVRLKELERELIEETIRLSSLSDSAVGELEIKLNDISHQLAQQKTSLQQKERDLAVKEEEKEQMLLILEQLKADISSVSETRTGLEQQLVELQDAQALEQQMLQTQLDSKLLQIDELNQTIRSKEELLKHHQLQVQQLQSEIEQLSTNQVHLEQLRQQLDTAVTDARASHQVELNKFQLDIKEKDQRISELTADVQESRRIHETLKLEIKSLEEKTVDLESCNFDYLAKTASLEEELEQKKCLMETELETAKEQYERDIANLQKDMLKLEQMAAQKSATFKVYEKEMKDLQDLVEQKSNKLFIEKERFQLAEANLKKEMGALKIMNSHENGQLMRNLERKERELGEMSAQLKTLQLQTEKLQTSSTALENEICLLRADNDQLSQAKSTAEESLQTARDKFNTELDSVVRQLQLRDESDARSSALEEKIAALEEEKNLLKLELKAEKDQVHLVKSQTALEHRKEKAVLEARVQLAQTQMKSMQEKLVNMTVANQSQTPLEHKISILTNELEMALKNKLDLEKKLKKSDDLVHEFSARGSKLVETQASKDSNTSDSETAILRKKYDSAKKTLACKEEVINQYALKFEKMQSQLDVQGEELATLTVDKRKLTFENRSLKVEQQHLLAQIAAEKDKATTRSTRLTLAMQRSNSESADGGTMADAMMDARRRSLRPSRSEIVQSTRSMNDESFKAPRFVFGDAADSSVFKVPSVQSSRRDSTSSISSNRSDVSTTSRLPHGAGRLFTCDDEDGELFSSSYLNEMKEGLCNVESSSQRRMSELHRRNTLQPPHMRSAYPTEMNDERLKKTNLALTVVEEPENSASEDNVQQLATATSRLSVHTPPAMNTRKRRSSLWNQADNDTPVVARKRRSFEADLSVETEDSRLSISSSAERKKRREPTQTSYKRPGPPTPARNSSSKENISTPSMSSTSSSPPKLTPKNTPKVSSKGNQSVKLTPASLVKKVQSKLRSNKQAANERTPTTPRGRSKLNIFRKPLGSRGYNSEAKF